VIDFIANWLVDTKDEIQDEQGIASFEAGFKEEYSDCIRAYEKTDVEIELRKAIDEINSCLDVPAQHIEKKVMDIQLEEKSRGSASSKRNNQTLIPSVEIKEFEGGINPSGRSKSLRS